MSFPQASPVEFKEKMRIAYVSSCLPRKCSIATYAGNLNHALKSYTAVDAAYFIALKDDGGYHYPPQVIFEIRQENREDYYKAADLVNSFGVDVVSLQHEFGLFGGSDGNYITEFLRYLQKPVVTTCHTVLKNPSHGQKKAFMKTASLSQALVVMNQPAISFMTDIYDIPCSKVRLIPHAVPETMESFRARLALSKKAPTLSRQKGWNIVSRQYMKTFADMMKPLGRERTPPKVRLHTLPVPI